MPTFGRFTDSGTVVGLAFTNTVPVSNLGLIRWANGGITLVHAAMSLVDRNDSGTSIGFGGSGEVLVRGTKVTPLQLNIQNSGFFSRGINNWGSIVGSYNTASGGGGGFKRWSNGGVVKLHYPGASSTFPTSINDEGAIVGSYFVGPSGVQLPQNGFIYHNGHWATLNYPTALFTDLVGISNAGIIVGNSTDTVGAFLYENGNFKVISGNGQGITVSGISPKLGLIVGTGNQGGFIAKCK
jgi:hypothetical protein